MNKNGNSLTTFLLATGLAALIISPAIIGNRLMAWFGRGGALTLVSVFMTIVAVSSGYFINEADQIRQSCGECIAALMSVPVIEFGSSGFWFLAVIAWGLTIFYAHAKRHSNN
ncbi:hypothetical protein [Methylomonas methanica]|uniref:Uncharacterized protein n=1 Tax=Methylomonas methanica TaxID=421 RepID=A0A177MYP7_METMH|nr:hypothetical protein [Methylomonas methanica]OAI10826.1 hypothetical protein A1332_23595 [Methylomonas methanica]